jgi:hypothetical protein
MMQDHGKVHPPQVMNIAIENTCIKTINRKPWIMEAR